jgi:hypothetical protein
MSKFNLKREQIKKKRALAIKLSCLIFQLFIIIIIFTRSQTQ